MNEQPQTMPGAKPKRKPPTMNVRVELVKRSAVRRFLQVDDAEVERLIEQDEMPYIRKPGATKPGVRIFLPDFHEWLMKYARGDSKRIADYQEFCRVFWGAQESAE